MTGQPWRTQRTHAFTLIEVLVVVAIIALLISILLPSLALARRQARDLKCEANLRDLANTFHLYASSHRGFFPITINPGADNFESLHFAKLLKSFEILLCPLTSNVIRPSSLKGPLRFDEFALQNGVAIPYLRSDLYDAASSRDDSSGGHSYEYIGCYEMDPHPPTFALSGYHKKVDHFRIPPHMNLMVFDNDDRLDSQASPGIGCAGSPWELGNNCPQPWDNHGTRGMNMMYADGHVNFVRKAKGYILNYVQSPPPEQGTFSENATIDTALMKGLYSYYYSGSRK